MSTSTPDLQTQITLLQQQLEQLQQAVADNLAPNYLSIGSNGQVIANLPGIILPTWETDGATGPAQSNYVEWRNPGTQLVDGGLIVQRSESGDINLATVQGKAEKIVDTSQAWLEARDTNDTLQAGVYATQSNQGGASAVYAQAAGNLVKLIDQSAVSDFLQKGHVYQVTWSGINLTTGSGTYLKWYVPAAAIAGSWFLTVMPGAGANMNLVSSSLNATGVDGGGTYVQIFLGNDYSGTAGPGDVITTIVNFS